MDPPGSFHLLTTELHSDDVENYNNDDEAEDIFDERFPNQEEMGEVARVGALNISAPETVAAAAEDTDDLQAMRSSLTNATENYRAHLQMGGRAITMKGSIDSTRVIVRVPSSPTTSPVVSHAVTDTPIIATTTTTAVSRTESHMAVPIIATAVCVEDNDPPDFRALVQSQQTSHTSSTVQPQVHVEQSNSQQDKYNSMINRLVSEQNFPRGLAQRLVSCVQTKFVKHYWLVDNSGSMLTNDCVRMIQRDVFDVGGSNPKNSKKLYDTVKCSRWNELEDAIISHVDVASILEVPTTFRLLQGSRGMQEFTINQTPGDAESAKSIVRQSTPDGVTLLSDHIHEICNQIEEGKELLMEKGQKAVVVIATDAIPSDQYGETSEEAKEKFLVALRRLQLLPVWIVIRLCTNDRKAMQYYRKLDKKLELPIECVSDYVTESKEVRRWNPWLNYSRQIHRCREMGSHHRVFDLLDERSLTKDDLLDFLMVLFGAETFDTNKAPSMHTDWNGFLFYLKTQVLNQCEKQYSLSTKKMEDVVDVKGLAAAYGLFRSLRNATNKIDYYGL